MYHKLHHFAILCTSINARYLINYISKLKSLKNVCNKIDPNDLLAFLEFILGGTPEKRSIFGNLLSCLKISKFYQDTNASVDETSTYQELAVPLSKMELTYHKTTLK